MNKEGCPSEPVLCESGPPLSSLSALRFMRENALSHEDV